MITCYSFQKMFLNQSRDIYLKNTIHTNQVGGHFRWQPATFDNPVVGLFVLHKACEISAIFSRWLWRISEGIEPIRKRGMFWMDNKVLLLACIE